MVREKVVPPSFENRIKMSQDTPRWGYPVTLVKAAF